MHPSYPEYPPFVAGFLVILWRHESKDDFSDRRICFWWVLKLLLVVGARVCPFEMKGCISSIADAFSELLEDL